MVRAKIGIVAAAGLGLALVAQAAAAGETCSSRASQCSEICAARPPVYPFTSRYDRCSQSCGPRWNQCLRDGVWVHLEDENWGWRERVTRF